MNSAIAVPALLLLLAVALSQSKPADEAAWRDLAPPKPVPDSRIAVNPREVACARCHAEIASEWAASLHGLSWLSEPYQEDVGLKKKPQGCWGCHAPQPLHQEELAQKPPFRETDRELGVWCESCHLGKEGEILGPFGAPTDAHRSAKHDSFVGAGSNALCAACHSTTIGPVIGIAKDFESTGQAARGRTCVGCHMAAVERPIANPPPDAAGAAATAARAGRSHALQTPRDPAFLRRAFRFSARVEGKRTLVRVENQAGHRVPGFIDRTIEIQAQVLAADGSVAGSGQLVLDHQDYLPADGTLEIAVPALGTSVRVVGRHHDPRQEQPVEFLDERLEIGAK